MSVIRGGDLLYGTNGNLVYNADGHLMCSSLLMSTVNVFYQGSLNATLTWNLVFTNKYTNYGNAYSGGWVLQFDTGGYWRLIYSVGGFPVIQAYEARKTSSNANNPYGTYPRYSGNSWWAEFVVSET